MKQRKYTRCSVCRTDSVLHFAGILGSGASLTPSRMRKSRSI